jgi:hypothetical protein
MATYSHNTDDVTLALTGDGQGATASTTFLGEHPYSAFDHNASTPWDANGAGPDWLKIDLQLAPGAGINRKASITSYTVTARNDSATYMKYVMNTWTLSGSNNDEDWTTLDTQASLSWSVGEMKTFDLAQASAFYRYFKIEGTAPSGNAGMWQLELIGVATEDHHPKCYLHRRKRDNLDMRPISTRNQYDY